MKKNILVLCLLMITAVTILAQAFIDGSIRSAHQVALPPPPYDGKTPPPIKMDEAYAKALSTLGDATNQFYCVSATSLTLVPRDGVMGGLARGWKFVFSSTNGTSKNVCVFFDKTAEIHFESTTTQ